jgi:drug/metabolite transporter (DMT)-like permease
LAFFGVIIWGIYSTYSSYKEAKLPVYMIGLYCGIAAIVCAILHINFEKTVVPTFGQGTMTMVLGLVGPGLAYQLWDYGMKFGNAKLLGVSCYLARVMSMTLLVWFGKEPFSIQLVVACALAITGVFICTIDDKWLVRIICAGFRKIRFKPNTTKDLVEDPQLV